MNVKSKASKAALLSVLLSAVFAVGCERRPADDQAAAESGAVGTSTTDTTTAARADAASSPDTSSSGASDSSGASATSSDSASSASSPAASADAAAVSSDSASSSSDSASASSGASSDSSGASSDSSGASSKIGAEVDDSVITTKLKAALLADSEIKGTDISVDTKQGEVTLSGTVKSAAQKSRIETIAKGIDGVKNVQDKLTVQQ